MSDQGLTLDQRIAKYGEMRSREPNLYEKLESLIGPRATGLTSSVPIAGAPLAIPEGAKNTRNAYHSGDFPGMVAGVLQMAGGLGGFMVPRGGAAAPAAMGPRALPPPAAHPMLEAPPTHPMLNAPPKHPMLEAPPTHPMLEGPPPSEGAPGLDIFNPNKRFSQRTPAEQALEERFWEGQYNALTKAQKEGYYTGQHRMRNGPVLDRGTERDMSPANLNRNDLQLHNDKINMEQTRKALDEIRAKILDHEMGYREQKPSRILKNEPDWDHVFDNAMSRAHRSDNPNANISQDYKGVSNLWYGPNPDFEYLQQMKGKSISTEDILKQLIANNPKKE